MKGIILVDDHIIIRDGLKELIGKLGPYRIVGEYNNGKELIDAFPLDQMPDLIIMDLSMPEMDGDEALEILNKMGIEVPILILTLNHDEQRIIRLFRAGVRGYLEKNCTAAMMKEALTEIFMYGLYHNELLSLALRTPEKPQKSHTEAILDKLSDREKEFLSLVCHEAEYTYDQIASMMGVVVRTVDGYRESIFQKFDIKSKTGLVMFAYKHHLLDGLVQRDKK